MIKKKQLHSLNVITKRANSPKNFFVLIDERNNLSKGGKMTLAHSFVFSLSAPHPSVVTLNFSLPLITAS